jgi:hypothetical protein
MICLSYKQHGWRMREGILTDVHISARVRFHLRGSEVRGIILYTIVLLMGQESAVGIATRYGLDGLGIESRWERNYPHQTRTPLVPT